MQAQAPTGNGKDQKEETKAENEDRHEGTVTVNEVTPKIDLHIHLKEYELYVVRYMIQALRKSRTCVRDIIWDDKTSIRDHIQKKMNRNGRVIWDQIHKTMVLDDEEILLVSRQFEKQRFLRSLSLTLGRNFCFTARGSMYLSESFRSLSSLQTLSLSFWMDIQGFKVLGDGFRSLSSLQRLTLEFNSLRYSAASSGLKSMMKNLRYLHSFQNFTLKWKIDEKTKRGLSGFSSGLRYVPSLKSLTLDLSESSLTDDDMKSLSEGFKYIPSLKSFTLNLLSVFSSRLSSKGFQYLSKGFQLIPSLQALSLNFDIYSQINDRSMQYLIDGFSYLSSLKILTLSLLSGYGSRLSHEALLYFSKGLAHVSSLGSLTLNFDDCTDITDKGLQDLSEGLKSFTCLHSLYLDFRECKQISKNAITALEDSLKLIKTLKITSIDS